MLQTENTPLIELEKENQKLQNEILELKEQLAWFQRNMFGKRSEKIVRTLNKEETYLPGFEEWFAAQEQEEKEIQKRKVAAHTRREVKRNGKNQITIPEGLPVERIELDVAEEEKVDSETGKPLVKIGEEVCRKLAHTPGSYFIKEYVRPKYALPEGAGIVTAELPDSIIPKCRVDESLLAEIITKKFADHLPLNRISEGMARDGVGISRQLLSQWVVRVGMTLKPLYERMLKEILESGNVFIDETPIDLLVPGKGKTHQSYMWVLAGGKERDPPNRIYWFTTNRRHENAFELIGDYRGILHSDKYGAYVKLAERKQITWCPCIIGHARRKFFEAESGDPKFRDWILRKMRYLSLFEKIAWSRSAEERLAIRQEKEAPILDELIAAVKAKLVDGKILPKSKFREALGYFYSLTPHLKNYTKDPWARLDNNVAERAVRSIAVGRKNWLFVGSENGGEAAAVLLSLVQTCRALKINPATYLDDILRRFMGHNMSKLDELLPQNWAKSLNLI